MADPSVGAASGAAAAAAAVAAGPAPLAETALAERLFREGRTPVSPSDAIFADAAGVVDPEVTPSLLLNAVLCDRWELVRYIEAGTFGRGWVATDRLANNRRVFVKTFRAPMDRPNEGDPAQHEAMLRKEIDVILTSTEHQLPAHPAIMSGVRICYGSVVVPKSGRKGQMFFLQSDDLCEGGELFNYLVVDNGVMRFDEPLARYFFRQLAAGVAHMHEHKLFHRDLKLENIVLDAAYNAKIMDFGLAKHASACVEKKNTDTGRVELVTTTYVGTASYQPPELTSDSPTYNPAAFDMWSLGVVLFFMTGIEALAAKNSDFDFMDKVRRAKDGPYKLLDLQVDKKTGEPIHPKFWEFFGKTFAASPELKSLLNGLFSLQSKTRLTAVQVLAHPWLRGPVPSAAEVAAAMGQRHAGISERELHFSLAARYPTQAAALDAIEAVLKPVTLVTRIGSKLAVGADPIRFVVAVAPSVSVRCLWIGGGLGEWLNFRFQLGKAMGLAGLA